MYKCAVGAEAHPSDIQEGYKSYVGRGYGYLEKSGGESFFAIGGTQIRSR